MSNFKHKLAIVRSKNKSIKKVNLTAAEVSTKPSVSLPISAGLIEQCLENVKKETTKENVELVVDQILSSDIFQEQTIEEALKNIVNFAIDTLGEDLDGTTEENQTEEVQSEEETK